MVVKMIIIIRLKQLLLNRIRSGLLFDASSYPGGYNVSCKGYNDGSAWIAAPPTGGNGGYRFKWYTFDGTITGPDTLDRLDNLTAGTYYLQITDRKGCIGIDSIKLTEPDGMVPDR